MVKIRVYEDKVKNKKGQTVTQVVIFGSLLEAGEQSDLQPVKKDAKVRKLKKK